MVAGAAICWGTWSIFLRPAEALGAMAPITEVCVVLWAAALFAWPFARRRPTPRPRSALVWLLCSGAADGISMVLFFIAMAHTTLAIANLTHYLAPIFVALAAPWVDRRPYQTRMFIAVATAVVGVGLLLQPWQGAGPGDYLGPLAGIASAILFAAHVLMSKHVSGAFSPQASLAWQRTVGAAIVTPFAWPGLWALQSTQVALLAAGGALICGVAGLVFFVGLGRCRADQASALTLLEPVSAICLGWLLWNERLDAFGMVGIALVFVGIWISLTLQNADDIVHP